MRFNDMPASKTKNNVLFLIDHTNSLWVYGWTHYQMAGQTEARMNQLTREVEIKDGKQWVKCISGCHEFFTSNANASESRCEDANAWG
jgi:hypothetical protein